MHKIVSAKIQKTLQTIDMVRLKNLNKHKNRQFKASGHGSRKSANICH